MRITKRCQHGNETTFYAPDSGGYVRHESGDDHGTLADQICHGGGYRGNTVRCGDTEESLKDAVNKWLRQARRSARNRPGEHCWLCGNLSAKRARENMPKSEKTHEYHIQQG